MTFNFLDWGIVVILVLTAFTGLWRGLIVEAISLIAWVLAWFVARFFAGTIAVHMTFISGDNGRYLAAFVLIFIVVLLVCGLIKVILQHFVRAVGLGGFDRLMGGLFGVFKGGLIVMAFVLIGGLSGLSQSAWWKASQLAPVFQRLVLDARVLMPDALASRVRFD